MSAVRFLLTLVLCGLLAATPVAAAVAPAGADGEAVEVECLAVARPSAVRLAPAAESAAPAVSSPSAHPLSARPAAAPAPSPVRTHVLHCVWRE